MVEPRLSGADYWIDALQLCGWRGHTLASKQASKQAKLLLAAGIVVNLGLLGYFKYANFFVDNLNALVGSSLTLETIILPLAISFFTFQQITYLVDALVLPPKSGPPASMGINLKFLTQQYLPHQI